MILVNISAVETSMTFTLQPVSSSHLGPEKFLGSRDCRPASQTMVMVLAGADLLGGIDGALGRALGGHRARGGQRGDCQSRQQGAPADGEQARDGVDDRHGGFSS